MMRDFGGSVQYSRVSARLALAESDPDEHLDSFAEAVRQGLSGAPKSLPCRFLYDEIGSALFEQICDLPEYYLTRAEHQILEDEASDIVAHLPAGVALAELGSGSSTKTRLLIESLLERQPTLRYLPVDISPTILQESARALLSDYPSLEVHAIAGEYEEGLRHLEGQRDRPKLIAWLGSNVGNFDRRRAARFLRGVRDAMSDRDRVLVGVDLRKSAEVLEAAYDDDAGVTARFSLNLLARINRELDGRFDLERFEHQAIYRDLEGRVDIGLVSRCDQEVEIAALESVVKFERGERIHTEDSYKYSVEEIDALAEGAGLALRHRWLDRTRAYSLNLLSAR